MEGRVEKRGEGRAGEREGRGRAEEREICIEGEREGGRGGRGREGGQDRDGQEQ